MSLINCHECDKHISDLAHYCPNCGFPFKNNILKLPEDMITVNDIAKHLGISKTTAYKLVRYKGFPKMYIGKRCFIKKDRYLKWVDENMKSRILL